MLLTWCTTDQRGRHDGFKLATLLNDTQPHAQWGWIKTVYLETHNAIVSVFLWRQMMVEKKGSVQTAKVLANIRTPLPPSPSHPLFTWFWSVESSLSVFGAPLVPLADSGYGAVASAGSAAALLLAAQLDPLALVLALPQAGSLQDLLHQLLKGTLDAVFGLRTGLCTKEAQMGDLWDGKRESKYAWKPQNNKSHVSCCASKIGQKLLCRRLW